LLRVKAARDLPRKPRSITWPHHVNATVPLHGGHESPEASHGPAPLSPQCHLCNTSPPLCLLSPSSVSFLGIFRHTSGPLYLLFSSSVS
jgi:hypothetical protein